MTRLDPHIKETELPEANPLIPQHDHPIAFLRGFLERPKEVGSIIPSSRWMERRITRTAKIASADLVIELGPGTGGTTKALLNALAPGARLLAIEINPSFCDLLRETIDDPRLIVHEGSAAEIPEALTKHDLDAPDVILSGIPGTRPLAPAIRAQEPQARWTLRRLSISRRRPHAREAGLWTGLRTNRAAQHATNARLPLGYSSVLTTGHY